MDRVVLGEDPADLLAGRLAERVQTQAGVRRHLLADIEVVRGVVRTDDGEVRPGVDETPVAQLDRGAHGVVRAQGVDVEGQLAVVAQHRAVDDSVRALGRAPHLARVGDIHLHGLVRAVDRLDVGDAQIVVAFQGLDHGWPQMAVAAQQQDFHRCSSKLNRGSKFGERRRWWW